MNTQAKQILTTQHMQADTEVLAGQDSLRSVDEKPHLTTASLFGSSKEVAIVHGRDEYMLRITKQGKLILTK